MNNNLAFIGFAVVVVGLFVAATVIASKAERLHRQAERKRVRDICANCCRSCGFAFGELHPNHCPTCGKRQSGHSPAA